ncbi:MAG: outer membrane protein assembly factor BamC [Paraglaciecola sp.]|jgi:outer membrane protein assembly factor BamC
MTHKFFVSSVLVMSCLTACTSVEDRQIASGGFDYIKEQPGQEFEVPQDVDSPKFSRAYTLPPLGKDAPQDILGEKLKIVSPSLVLPLVSGSHVEDGSKEAIVLFDQVDDSQALDTTIWNSLLSYLEEQLIGIEKFDKEKKVLITDWMVITETLDDHWYSWSAVEKSTRQRFEFTLEMKPHGRTAALHVRLLDYQEVLDKDIVANMDDTNVRAKEVDILNKVIGHYEYQIRVATAKRIRDIRRGAKMELGLDEDGAPAFVIDAKYETAWPRVLLVLRKLGFDVKDYDQSNGLLFVNYNGTQSGWWSSLWSSDANALALSKDEYRFKMSELDGKSTLTLLNGDNTAFSQDKLAALYETFARVMADDNLDI